MKETTDKAPRKPRTPRKIIVEMKLINNHWERIGKEYYTTRSEALKLVKQQGDLGTAEFRVFALIYQGTPTVKTKTSVVL